MNTKNCDMSSSNTQGESVSTQNGMTCQKYELKGDCGNGSNFWKCTSKQKLEPQACHQLLQQICNTKHDWDECKNQKLSLAKVSDAVAQCGFDSVATSDLPCPNGTVGSRDDGCNWIK